jgi:hypothetical protein
MLKIEVDEGGYQLVGPNGEESGVTDYGEMAEVECEGGTYAVLVEDREDALENDIPVYQLMAEVPEVEEVEFSLEDEGDAGDEGDDEGDEEEAAGV